VRCPRHANPVLPSLQLSGVALNADSAACTASTYTRPRRTAKTYDRTVRSDEMRDARVAPDTTVRGGWVGDAWVTAALLARTL